MANEILFMSLPGIVHVDLESIRKLRRFTRAYQVDHFVSGFRERPAIDAADDACANNEYFHFSSNFSS
jgi:hypothetical protein